MRTLFSSLACLLVFSPLLASAALLAAQTETDERNDLFVSDTTDRLLEPKYRGHDPGGDLAGYRECHIKPDLLLIYRKSGSETVRLARL